MLLGIDVGTTAIKALLVNEEGRVVGQAGAEYESSSPQPGWHEQDPEDWWRGVCAAVAGATAGVDRSAVRALALSTQGDTMAPVDAEGRALAPARTWLDARTEAETRYLEAQRPREDWYRRCGTMPAPYLAACTPLHLQWHRPDVFRAAARFALVEDFLVHRLTGRWLLSAANASRTLLFDITRRAWDDELLAHVGLTTERVSPVAESGTTAGTLTSEAAEALGLRPDVAVALGGHDQCCAATGCGALAPGRIMLSCGTAWALTATLTEPRLDPEARLTTYCHVFPGRWVLLGAQPGGVLLRWFRDELCPDLMAQAQPGPSAWPSPAGGRGDGSRPADAYDLIIEEALRADPAAPPLLFLPHMYGAVTPAWQPQARAGFVGLTLQHTRGHLARAVLEAAALEAAWNVQVMEESAGEVAELRMIGGAAKSPAWAQIVADATGKRVLLPEVGEAAAYGAALLAGRGAGLLPGTEEITSTLRLRAALEPQPSEVARLREVFRTYQRLFWPLAELWGSPSAEGQAGVEGVP